MCLEICVSIHKYKNEMFSLKELLYQSKVMTPLVLVVEQLKEDYDRLYPRDDDDSFDDKSNSSNQSVKSQESGTKLSVGSKQGVPLGSIPEEEIWAIFRAVWDGVSTIVGEKGTSHICHDYSLYISISFMSFSHASLAVSMC
jgi:hypothetical protein